MCTFMSVFVVDSREESDNFSIMMDHRVHSLSSSLY
jgi:hypothetical protein